MTKHLRFLFVMLLAMIWSAGWAQTTVDFSKGLPSGWSKTGTVANQTYQTKNCIQLQQNATITSPAFEEAYSSMKISMTRSNPATFTIYYQVGSASAVELKTFSNDDVAKRSWKDYIVDIPAAAQVANCKFIFKSSASSYFISTIEFTSAGSTKTATNVSFGENSGMKFTFSKGVYTEGEFTTPIAKEKNNIAGTVVYSSNNEAAISVDASTGKLTFNDFGEATITATFTPNNTEIYKSSNDSYEVVNDNPDVRKVTFIDTVDKGKNQSTGKSETINKDGVTIYASNAAFGYKTKYRFYKDGTINISATTGTITRIDFAGGEDLTNLKGDGFTATAKDATWTGNARSVVLTNDIGSAKARTITVYVALPSEITLNENSESNTIEAKTGVNVTLKRSMVANEWNTICLPFDVSKEKAQTAFGEGVKIAQLDDKNSTGNTLKFVNMTDYGMQATVPYLIKPSKENTSNEYVFENVNVVADDINKKYERTEDYLVFKGIYNMMDITKDVVDNVDATYYAAFLGAGNKIYKAGTGKTKGFRAYFAIPNDAAASALRVVIDGTATSIKNIDSEVVESNAPVYNLQGQRVDGNNLTPGIYVKAGKKFVVK